MATPTAYGGRRAGFFHPAGAEPPCPALSRTSHRRATAEPVRRWSLEAELSAEKRGETGRAAMLIIPAGIAMRHPHRVHKIITGEQARVIGCAPDISTSGGIPGVL